VTGARIECCKLHLNYVAAKHNGSEKVERLLSVSTRRRI
jgi:hypothetical protein